jgi:hypothetical protein
MSSPRHDGIISDTIMRMPGKDGTPEAFADAAAG